eukprot:CAMPEP_0170992798 /NCGR_PEP_ID=MMETSP0736-20130129/9953_1 /TAXON_ID=186038 /ORGANISM="Fragilariopsis kerguelensis, Strain L26-C5" /LENGTH=596 /DNA_ID=CAMNT_0011418315 /DNA_START=608 /DNA_END=2395 /DNA_ORIENTATION=-
MPTTNLSPTPTPTSSIISPSPHLSTTAPDIRYEFKSLHASPFRLLAILEPTTPIISIPLCTTSSTSHLLAFLESTVPSLPPPLWPFFVIFFLPPIGTVHSDTDITTNNNLLECSTATSTVYTAQYVKDDNNVTTSDVAMMTTTIYESNAATIADNDSSATIAMIPQLYSSPSEHVSSLSSSTLWLHLRCDNYNAFLVILFLSPVGTVTLLRFWSNLFLSPAVDSTTTFHLIDQGKVGYLYHLQILLFFNLQDASLRNNVSSLYTLWLDLHQHNNNGRAGDNNGSIGRVITAMEYLVAVHGGISSDTSTGQAPYDYYYGDTAVSSPSIVIDPESSIDFEDTDSSPYSTAVTQTIISYDTYFSTVFDGRTGKNDLDLYFATVFHGRTDNNDNNYGDITASNSIIVTIIVAVTPAVVKMKIYATIFITLLRSHIIDHGSLLYLTQQILCYNQQYVYDHGNNNLVSSVTVTSAVAESSFAIITALYEMLSAVNIGTIAAVTIMTTTVPVTYEATSSAVKTTTSNESPFAGNDSPLTIMVATQVDSSRSSSSSYDNSYTGTDGANDNVMSSSTDDEATSVSVPAAVTIMPTAIIMMTTAFH